MRTANQFHKKYLSFAAPLTVALVSLCYAPFALALDLETVSTGKISLSFPKSWKKEAKLDKNILFKAAGPYGQSYADLTLNQAEAANLSVTTLAQVLEESVLSKMPNFKSAGNKQTRFGGMGAFTGLEKTVYFANSGTDAAQRYLFFNDGGQCYFLVLTCPKDNLSSCDNLWSETLRNLSIAKQNTQASAPRPQSLTEKTYRGEKSIEFKYPATFESESVEGRDHLVKLTNNVQGKFATVEVYRGEFPYAQSLETMTGAFEEKYFSGEKDYRKIKEENGTIGCQSNINAITRECTLTMNGMPIHQIIAFFRTDKWLYCLSFSTANWNSNEAFRQWSRLTSTLKVTE